MRSAALFVSLVVGYPIAAHAQSASTVIERHINALGGRKAIEQIVSTEVSGVVASADGRSGVFAQRTRRPQLFSTSLSWGEARWRTGFNGRSAWQDDSNGWRTLYGAAAARVRAEAFHANTRFLVPEKVNQVFVTGQERVRDRPAIAVVAITADGTRRTLFFDAQSYLLVKDEQQTDAGVETRFFDDYRRVDQVMEPHRIEWQRNGETFRIVVERVTHNAPVEEHAFDVPATPAEPALNMDAVLSAATRNEQRIARQLASYTYTSTSTSERIDEHGQSTLQEGESYEVFFLGDQGVRRLIRKRGGQALSEAERRAEDERVNRIVREYEAQRASGKPARPAVVVNDTSGTAVRTPVLGANGLTVYRRMCDFTNVRRERVGGRATVVVEFQPKRNVSPNGDLERQATKMAGTVWIDEAMEHIIRVDAYFTDDHDRTIQGSSKRNERILVNNEVWVPSRDETNVRWSFAFGNRSQFLSTTLFTDYKKFSVDTDATITLPDAGR